MPRPLRINFPNACYHVMNRGAGRRKIFTNNSHRMMFLDLLKESYEIFSVKIYAYCLMDNHYHLLLSTPDANLARIMRHINGVYTQKFNRLQKTDGPLFRGRYKAQLVDEDCYQLMVSRYIHLNPVEAALVSKPADYKWSSYSAYLGLVKSPSWLSVDILIKQLVDTKALSHVKNYQDYVEGKITEEINVFRSMKHIAPIIGSESFKEKMMLTVDPVMIESCSADFRRIRTVPDIELIVDKVCSYYEISRDLMVNSNQGRSNWHKSVCIYICRKRFGYTLRAVAKYVGLCRYESVSTAVRRCHLQLLKYPNLMSDVEAIVKTIIRVAR